MGGSQGLECGLPIRKVLSSSIKETDTSLPARGAGVPGLVLPGPVVRSRGRGVVDFRGRWRGCSRDLLLGLVHPDRGCNTSPFVRAKPEGGLCRARQIFEALSQLGETPRVRSQGGSCVPQSPLIFDCPGGVTSRGRASRWSQRGGGGGVAQGQGGRGRVREDSERIRDKPGDGRV